MKRNTALLSFAFFLATAAKAQNIGINNSGASPDASAMLDISSANKGLLIPRVGLSTTNNPFPVNAPATGLVVFNTATAGSGITAVTPGLYFWNGSLWNELLTPSTGFTPSSNLTTQSLWKNGGNSLFTTGNLGTTSNNHIDIISNGIIRGRISNLGEFFWGATNTIIPGDLMNGISNATFPFAVNGYSSFNGSGVYGSVTAGTTTFAAVQGEYGSATSAGANTSGVRGINQSPVAGNGFRFLAATGPRVGINGTTNATNGQYTFGLHGAMGSTDIRCGGIIGDDFGIALGALGYYASNLSDYSVYGFGGAYQVGNAGGRMNQWRGMDQPNTHIGLGIYGGVMGGWIRGLVYGGMMKGDRYGLYVDGKTYTNAPLTELIPTGEETRTPAYAVTSLTTDIYAKGKATLSDGAARIDFDPSFLKLISEKQEDVIVTITPTGNSKGLFIAAQDARGFIVEENERTGNAVSFNWIAIATRKNAITHSPEILRTDFDTKMNGVMYNDNNTTGTPQPLWWDGTTVRFDTPPKKQSDPAVPDMSRTISGGLPQKTNK